MRAIWKQHRWILISVLLFWVSIGIWLIVHGKEDACIHINNYRFEVLDSSMPFLTYLGDGIMALVVGLLLLFRSYRSAFMILSAFVVSGLLAQFFKGVVFPDMLRPLAYFEQLGIEIQTLENVKVRRHHSFPSGHTTSAFALFFGLILVFKNKVLGFSFLLLAMIAGYSRVYLGQHFTEDVLAGAILGTSTAIGSYLLWKKAKWKFLDNSILNTRQYES